MIGMKEMLTKETAEIRTSKDVFLSFCETAGRFYRYPLYDQIAIFAQKPDASAVTTKAGWEKRGFSISEGAQAVMLLDNTKESGAKYVFDISDVSGEGLDEFKGDVLWSVDGSERDTLISGLEKSLDYSNPVLYDSASRIMTYTLLSLNSRDRRSYKDITRATEELCSENSAFMKLTAEQRESMAASIVSSMVTVEVASRLGVDRKEYENSVNMEALGAVGNRAFIALATEAQKISEDLLHDMYEQVKEIKANKEREEANESIGTLPVKEQEISAPGAESGETAERDLGSEEGRMVKEEQAATVQLPDDNRGTESEPETDGETGERRDGELSQSGLDDGRSDRSGDGRPDNSVSAPDAEEVIIDLEAAGLTDEIAPDEEKGAKIEDFGKHIGGARKELYGNYVTMDDIGKMNSREKYENVNKNKLWLRDKPEELIKNGMPQAVAYFRNEMRKLFPPSPVLYSDYTEERKLEVIEAYAKSCCFFRDKVSAVKTEKDVMSFYDDVILHRLDGVTLDEWVKDGDEEYQKALDRLVVLPNDGTVKFERENDPYYDAIKFSATGAAEYTQNNYAGKELATLKSPDKAYTIRLDKDEDLTENPSLADPANWGKWIVYDYRYNAIGKGGRLKGFDTKEEADRYVNTRALEIKDETIDKHRKDASEGMRRYTDYKSRTRTSYLDHEYTVPVKMIEFAKDCKGSYSYGLMEKEAKKKLFGIPKGRKQYVYHKDHAFIRRFADNIGDADYGRIVRPEHRGDIFFYDNPQKDFRTGDEWNEPCLRTRLDNGGVISIRTNPGVAGRGKDHERIEQENWEHYVPGEYVAIFEDASGRWAFKEGFKTKEEAEAFIEEYCESMQKKSDDLEKSAADKKKEAKKEQEAALIESGEQKYTTAPVISVVRKGDDVRNGKNVGGQDYLDTFKMRGGEFGNWVNNKERQECVNAGYDSFMDIAKALGIKPESVSLGGELAIAFGARGKGAALAHYEPARNVINLTKMKGAGSLAHEWAHALDNYVGSHYGVENDEFAHYATEATKSTEGKLPEKVRAVYESLSMRRETPQEIYDRTYKENLEKIISELRYSLFVSCQTSEEAIPYTTTNNKEWENPEKIAEFGKALDSIIGIELKKGERDPFSRNGDYIPFARYSNGVLGGGCKPVESLRETCAWIFAGKKPREADYTKEEDYNLYRVYNIVYTMRKNHEKAGEYETAKNICEAESLDEIRKLVKKSEEPFKEPDEEDIEKVKAYFKDKMQRLEQSSHTDYFTASEKAFAGKHNAGSAQNYGTEPTEMFARAFALYIDEKLKAMGMENTYLVRHEPESSNTIPRGKEKEDIFKTFDEFIECLKEEKLVERAEEIAPVLSEKEQREIDARKEIIKATTEVLFDNERYVIVQLDDPLNKRTPEYDPPMTETLYRATTTEIEAALGKEDMSVLVPYGNTMQRGKMINVVETEKDLEGMKVGWYTPAKVKEVKEVVRDNIPQTENQTAKRPRSKIKR